MFESKFKVKSIYRRALLQRRRDAEKGFYSGLKPFKNAASLRLRG